jgi:23S rRNA (cytosine1962-C5)-methyltransferase
VTTNCDDAFDALKQYLQDRQSFDVIILDPPAFVKKAKDKTEGLLAYLRINELALKLLTPGGILVSCSCSMHVSMQDLIDILQRISAKNNFPLQILERGHQGPDHPLHPAIPETDYLKALFVRKMTTR